MLSNRPYLLRAFYQWIVDSNCNPILVIDANNPRSRIPKDFVEGGEIVFNISPSAIRDLKISNDNVDFKASFSGVIHFVSAPIKAVLAVYAEENGEGIFFDSEEDAAVEEEQPIGRLQSLEMENLVASKSVEQRIEPVHITGKGKPVLKLVE